MSLYETAKANNIRDIPAWLLACGRAYYLYRANRTLTRRMQEGFKAGLDKNELFDARITAFADDASDGFDWTPYLPWNFRQEPTGFPLTKMTAAAVVFYWGFPEKTKCIGC